MPLILAIEPDRRQATQLTAIVRSRLQADLVLGDSAEEALVALGTRVPDLILTSALLSPRDESALGERLRALNGAAAHVQTLTIPVLGAAKPRSTIARGLLSALRRNRPAAPVIDGCDPVVFADQCAAYLERAEAERAQIAADEPDGPVAIDEACHEDALEAAIDETVAEMARGLATGALAEEFEVVEPGDTDQGDEPLTIEFDLSRLVDAIALPHVEVSPVQSAAAPLSLGVRWQWPAIEGAAAESPFILERPIAGPAIPPPVDSRLRRGPDTMPTDPITPHGTRPAADPLTPARPAAARPKPRTVARPVQDEWGFFDPDQCGFTALLEKIDELSKPA